MTGMRPVVDIMFGDFLTLIMDQLVNQAAKIHYMSGGKLKVPLTVRTTLGATRRSAAQHSQSCTRGQPHPRSEGRAPATPYDAKGLLKTAIRDDNPVVFFEDKMMYQLKGPVPPEEYTIPFGVADVKREGATSRSSRRAAWSHVALEAAASSLEARRHQRRGRRPAHHVPLDRETLIESVKKTGRAIVVDEGYESYGVTAEIAAVIADGAFLASRRAGEAHGRHGRARAVLAGARRPDRADAGASSLSEKHESAFKSLVFGYKDSRPRRKE
jgi:pyruvate/2-oxoglutarate/acetoin dehydrogenase E1 component